MEPFASVGRTQRVSEEQDEIMRSLARREIMYMRVQRRKIGIEDFELLTVVGNGVFGEKITAVPKLKKERAFGFLDTFGLETTLSHRHDLMEVKVSEVDSAASANIYNIQIRSDGEFFAYWPNFNT
ncbi:unnamed protein product [Eruca vesicaria subsp. sativa]|uniref:Uncharacterized protein n=1 Tax=Eruca vesicaria subsp. sativa TaxID=29727 RepID=A0ABC8JAK4_ERUVS|nr:unnamed protein product [Eruca vesicaria subsp. sativa]